MSDDARPLIDNPYRASSTPIIAGDVNVTDLMARAWDRGFAAGDERLRSDFQSAASPDERLREALRDANEYLAQIADVSPSEVADAIDSVRAQIKDALAATDSRGKPDGASVPDQSCATCGGSGDRNGNRRAADPFGTCPGCGGTGNVAAADREAPDGPRCNCVQYIEGDVTYHASGCPRAPVSDEPKLRRDTGGEAADFLGGYPPVPDETEES